MRRALDRCVDRARAVAWSGTSHGEDRDHARHQRGDPRRARRARPDAARRAAHRPRPHRDEDELPRRRVRRLHGARRRRGGERVPVPGRGGPGPAITTIEGLAPAAHAPPPPGGLHGARRGAVRLLHPGHDSLGEGVSRRMSAADGGAGPRGARRQSVPVHRATRRSSTPSLRRIGAPRADRRWRRDHDDARRRAVAAAHRRAGQGDGLARSTPPTSRCPACSSARSSAAPSRTPASCSSTPAGVAACPACAPSSPPPTLPTCATAPPSRTSRSSPRDIVRYVGQPVAAVAATTPEAAEAALAAIEVVYEPLPAVFDLAAALAPARRSSTRGGSRTSRSRSCSATATCAIARASSSATSSAAWRRPTGSSSTASPPRWCTRATPSRARRSRVGQLGAGHGVVEHAAALRRAEHAGRDPGHAAVEDPRDRAGRRRRLRRQAARRRRALRRAAREEVRPAGQDHDDRRGGADRGLSAPGHDRSSSRPA